MSRTSSAVKNKWNKDNYDRLTVMIPKGRKMDIEAHAQSKGLSVNGLINSLLREDMKLSEDEWKGGAENG